ncbi:MAG: hypothetical protein U0807_13690 [Candidatus Binatia bacterium]
MSGLEVFDPTAAFDPSWTGAQGAERLLAAAQHFPGGPVMLVFVLFWAPVGPGIPAGVLLARHVPLPPAVTFGLYALSDVMGACLCHPIFMLLRRHGRRVPALRALGRRFLALATWGVPVSSPAAADEPAGHAPALFRIATVGFGVDVYTAGLLATGLPVPRIPAWAAAVAGDLVWFALLLASSIAAAGVLDDDRFVGLVVIVAMIAIPRIARRLFPVLRG